MRWRLVALIAIPTIAATALGGLRIEEATHNTIVFQRVERLSQLGGAVIQLANALADERDVTAGYIAEGRPKGTMLQSAETQNATNRAASRVRGLAGQIGSSYPAQTRTDLTAILDRIADLPNLRDAATSTKIPAITIISDYSNSVADLLALNTEIAQGSADVTLADNVRTLDVLSRMEDEASQQRGILYSAMLAGTFGPGSQSALTNAQAQQAADFQQFQSSASLNEQQAYNDTVTGPLVDQSATIETQELGSGTPNTGLDATVAPQVKASTWYKDMSYTVGRIRAVQRNLINSVISRANSLHATAVQSVAVTGVVILIILIIVLLITTIVARSMVSPLRNLRAAALEIAGVRLPEMVRRFSEEGGAGEALDVEPIHVDSTDEIGEVARAFDQVHREALRLAANEAALRGNVNAMFVNLSRRSQSLVERQIRLIDDLEQGEQDAERLSSLFQMDHLATRMRRNSENLLVLAGHDASRRWNQPVALVDVLRAAVSEIEQYERVSLNVQPGIAVRGQGVNDVVHLLAELAENATSFSSVETPVTIAGHLLNSGGVLLDMTDRGVGMGAEEMAHANWRLDNPPVVDVAVSRRMGLFVVARLAARHGIRVRLRSAPTGGLTALVWLPDEVVTHEMVGPSPGLRRFERDSPGSVELPPTVGPFATEWPSGDRNATEQAVTASRAPRFTPLRTENGDAAPAYPQVSPSWDTGPVSSPRPSPSAPATGPLPVFGAPVNGGVDEQLRSPSRGDVSYDSNSTSANSTLPRREVVVPPAADAGQANRLPIFESVESDWFRRGKHSAEGGAATPVESVPSWTSAGDEGWRAAEAVHTPSSGGVTVSGLPKRVPKANLVPGTAAAAGGGDMAPAVPSARSASVTRDRFASFQRGVREGRASLVKDDDSGGEDDGV